MSNKKKQAKVRATRESFSFAFDLAFLFFSYSGWKMFPTVKVFQLESKNIEGDSYLYPNSFFFNLNIPLISSKVGLVLHREFSQVKLQCCATELYNLAEEFHWREILFQCLALITVLPSPLQKEKNSIIKENSG